MQHRDGIKEWTETLSTPVISNTPNCMNMESNRTWTVNRTFRTLDLYGLICMAASRLHMEQITGRLKDLTLEDHPWLKDMTRSLMNIGCTFFGQIRTRSNEFSSDGVQHVWRDPDRVSHTECIVLTVKHGGVIWGRMRAKGVGPFWDDIYRWHLECQWISHNAGWQDDSLSPEALQKRNNSRMITIQTTVSF